MMDAGSASRRTSQLLQVVDFDVVVQLCVLICLDEYNKLLVSCQFLSLDDDIRRTVLRASNTQLMRRIRTETSSSTSKMIFIQQRKMRVESCNSTLSRKWTVKVQVETLHVSSALTDSFTCAVIARNSTVTPTLRAISPYCILCGSHLHPVKQQRRRQSRSLICLQVQKLRPT